MSWGGRFKGQSEGHANLRGASKGDAYHCSQNNRIKIVGRQHFFYVTLTKLPPKFKTFIPATEPPDARRVSEGFQKGSLKGSQKGSLKGSLKGFS